MTHRTPAQLFSLIIGALILAVGIIGFFYQSSFTSNSNVHEEMFGWFSVNGWDNLLHVIVGAIGLIAVASVSFSRIYSLVVGILFVVMGVWGFILGGFSSILGVFPVNTGDNIMHLVIGVLGLIAVTVSMEHVPGRNHPTATV